jgi:hypothetical protein
MESKQGKTMARRPCHKGHPGAFYNADISPQEQVNQPQRTDGGRVVIEF